MHRTYQAGGAWPPRPAIMETWDRDRFYILDLLTGTEFQVKISQQLCAPVLGGV